MIKADPKELRALQRDLERIRSDHSNVINAEPPQTLKNPIEDAIRYTKKRWADLDQREQRERRE